MSFINSLTAKQKALKINLDETIYGSFAEIGAGQEVVRFFFRVGGASGTIANAMSAYDKEFSDAKYGKEPSGRYVCKSRLDKMLDFEYKLIEDRLKGEVHKNKRYFSFANTIATINYYKTFKGHGWLGVRFQLDPDGPTNNFIIHVKLHDNDAILQQEAIGILGVNMIHACFHLHHNPKQMLLSLYDELSRDRIEVDMVHLGGPNFESVDNRLLSLLLVKNGMTDAVIFGPDGNNIHPSDILYKKNILTLRGRFRPVTKVNIDMIKNGYQEFTQETNVDEDNLLVLFEMTLNNLNTQGDDINEQDFLDRADILCSLGQTVLVSNYSQYYKLVEYFSQYTKKKMGLIMGTHNFSEVLNEKYYRDLNGGILEACGILFTRNLKIYLYPFKGEGGNLITSENLAIHPRLQPLLEYLKFNKRVKDLENADVELLDIFSDDVIHAITNGESGWEEKVPTYVDNIIKEKSLFGYAQKKTDPSKQKNFVKSSLA